ncbi:hypothetical protein LSAT2_030608 [Lamellibrachia satsuma]|nr:hypothetical protein LSAT2_030608 [Lamellibrachia satsuma]
MQLGFIFRVLAVLFVHALLYPDTIIRVNACYGSKRKPSYRRRVAIPWTPPPPDPTVPLPLTGKGPVITIGGPDDGKPCVFPFYYRGIRYDNCTSSGGPYWCSTVKYHNYTEYGLCPTATSRHLFRCSFETSNGRKTWCNMSQIDKRGNRGRWLVLSGPSRNHRRSYHKPYGPKGAFNGKYYTHADLHGAFALRASLLLPPIDYTGVAVVNFRYIVAGGDVGGLQVYLRRRGQDLKHTWQVYGNQSDEWHHMATRVNLVPRDQVLVYRLCRWHSFTGLMVTVVTADELLQFAAVGSGRRLTDVGWG